MRVAVVGSRDLPRRYMGLVSAFVSSLSLGDVVVSGGADGVDEAAATFARIKGLHVNIILADWNGPKGRGAGLARNSEIVDSCDQVAAFVGPCRRPQCSGGRCPKGGRSHGTADAIEKARAAGKLTLLVEVFH